jgi:hypothetical protein
VPSHFIGDRNPSARQCKNDDVVATGVLAKLRREHAPRFAAISVKAHFLLS